MHHSSTPPSFEEPSTDRAPGVVADVYFAMVPEWLLDAKISANACKLYAILRRYADKGTSEAHPSRRTLANRMGFTRPQSVDGIVLELQTVGALVVFERFTDRGDRDSNGYRLFMTPFGAAHGVGGQSARPVGKRSARPVVRHTAHNPESQEPEPQEPENQGDSSSSVTGVDARESDDDESYPQIPSHLVDTEEVRRHLVVITGRDARIEHAIGVTNTVLDRTKKYPAKPTAYVKSAVTRNVHGWANYIDTGKVPS